MLLAHSRAVVCSFCVHVNRVRGWHPHAVTKCGKQGMEMSNVEFLFRNIEGLCVLLVCIGVVLI
jgi:hypothetical protein